MTSTIYALATSALPAAVAIIRLSGPGVRQVLERLTQKPVPPPRSAALRGLLHPDTGEELDKALVLFFAAPASYTGEDVAELHLHGGRAVVAGVTAALSALGLSVADPGAFTRRAFENNKMDLTEAEAVADLVAAETALQRRQSLRQMDGALSKLYESWRDRLVRALANLEAAIDFSDEEIPPDLAAGQHRTLTDLQNEITAHLADSRRGERLRDGFSIAILGAPNAGKSSLLNVLAGREAAIVSARAGTTRDIVEAHLDINGYPVILADTAGLRETTDDIEEEGIRRARARAGTADLKLLLLAPDAAPDATVLSVQDAETICILTKADLGPPAFPPPPGCLILSTQTGAGIDALIQAITARLDASIGTSAAPALTRARHREALTTCRDSLTRALSAPLPELQAEDTRLAARALGRITGRVDVEDLLDIIFRDFCIGK
jgi:tRNA modification GTPase